MESTSECQAAFLARKSEVLNALDLKLDRRDTSTISTSVYNFLDNLNLVTIGCENHTILTNAIKELIVELRFKLTLAYAFERITIKTEINSFTKYLTGDCVLSYRLRTLAKMRAKKLAIDAFLNNALINETDLEGLIDSRKGMFLEDK